MSDQIILPKRVIKGSWEELERQGITVIGEEEYDFQVLLPKGWTRTGSGALTWEILLDQHGRKRANIFLKSASFAEDGDDDGFMEMCQRYSIESNAGAASAQILDGNVNVVHQINDQSSRQAAILAASNWLNVTYPDWQNVTAYWN